MRLLLAAIVVALASGACSFPSPSTPEAPADPPRASTANAGDRPLIRFGDTVNVDVRDVPVLMAIDDVRAQGYPTEIRHVPGPPLVEDLLARGELDIGVTNYQTMWSAIAKGADVRSIAEFVGPTTVLAARRSIDACAALDGRPMGVYAPTGLSQILVQTYLVRRCAGAAPRLIVLEESSSRVAALMAGRLDAAVIPGEAFVRLELAAPGRFHALMTHRKEFPEMRIDGFHVRRSWAAEHPQAVRDFIRAVLLAQRLVTGSPEVLFAEARKRIGLDERTTRAVADTHLKMRIWDPDGGLTEERVAYVLDFLVKADGLPPGLRVADVADLSYLNAVLDDIGRRRPIEPRP
jgi:ABC-type nitrate/sulfonate/bicarbonate transport system substrate-binding protein